MSFDVSVKFLRKGSTAVVIALALLASSCQVRPLYSESTGVARNLAAISYSPAGSRVGQQVRNRLIFLTSGGAGEPAKADYDVQLTVASYVTGVLLVESSDTARAGQIVVNGDYTMRRVSDGQVLRTGHRSATSLVDFPVQEFAKLRAIRDAENRAARELAELIRTYLAIALGR